MAITAEWIKNKAKNRIYAISHAKAVVRGSSNVDADLAALEKTVGELQTKVTKLEKDFGELQITSINSSIR